jgi:hypothetical protein
MFPVVARRLEQFDRFDDLVEGLTESADEDVEFRFGIGEYKLIDGRAVFGRCIMVELSRD